MVIVMMIMKCLNLQQNSIESNLIYHYQIIGKNHENYIFGYFNHNWHIYSLFKYKCKTKWYLAA